jgi:hypothetical protein
VKNAKQKRQVTNKGKPNKMTEYFSIQSLNARRDKLKKKTENGKISFVHGFIE